MQQSNIVDHIVAFTSQRDTEMLEFSLLKSIRNLLDSNKSSIISIDTKGEIVSEMVHEGDNYVVRDSRFLVQEMLLKAFALMNSSGLKEYTIKDTSIVYSILKILDDNYVEKFLIIERENQIGKEETYVLTGILSIYNNFITLLKESQIDELTGLANRKTFETAIKKIFKLLPQINTIENERRYVGDEKEKLPDLHWLAIIDIDDFKIVNDNYGHLYGDEILIQLAQIIRASFREEDLKFRFGGEEFIILLRASSIEACKHTLERFREIVASHEFPRVGQVTLSIGAVQFTQDKFYVTFIDYADQALYHSKGNGKNQVTFFEDMLAQGKVKINEIEGGEVDLF